MLVILTLSTLSGASHADKSVVPLPVNVFRFDSVTALTKRWIKNIEFRSC